MPRYKVVDRNPKFIPVVLSEQIQPGTFEFTLDHLVDHELDLSPLDAKFKNDVTGATAYDPRVMLKIVLLGYSRGLISSRSIESACQQNVLFMAISGDLAPSYTHIAKFVRELGEQDLDERRRAQVERIRQEAQVTRQFVAKSGRRLNVLGSGSEQAALLPMVEQSKAFGTDQTVITADAGYHRRANVEELRAQNRPAMIADNGMRKRDERLAGQAKHRAKPDPLHDKTAEDNKPKLFRPKDFKPDFEANNCKCPAGELMYSNGSNASANGLKYHKFTGAKGSCLPCGLREQCLRNPETTAVRQVAIFYKNPANPRKATELMKQAIDSERGRGLYSQRIGTIEPVFGNIRHNKRLNRFTLRGQCKVRTQWSLYCLVHSLEKIANR